MLFMLLYSCSSFKGIISLKTSYILPKYRIDLMGMDFIFSCDIFGLSV